MTLADKVIELLQQSPGLSDRVIADHLLGSGKHQAPVNMCCRALEKRGVLRRQKDATGRIRNYLTGDGTPIPSESHHADTGVDLSPTSEDALKRILRDWLEGQGWNVRVAWGHARGVDIEATRNLERWLIEVKGEGSRGAMRVNYFLGILGESLQRMDDPHAHYSIALPDLSQFRRLWDQLPSLAKSRTGITLILVSEDQTVHEIS
jgi:hypothetical protein